MRHLLRLVVSALATLMVTAAVIAVKVRVGGGENFWLPFRESLIWNVPVFSLLTWAVWEIGAWNTRAAQRERP